jgi:stalled ribosome rescue protein Dom34
MSFKNKKQFGVWMDTHHATVIGHADADAEEFSVIGHAENPRASGNADEKSAHNLEQGSLHHYFKEIASHLTNATGVHVTGTGTAQEQFLHFLADTAQFKNVVVRESTSNRMDDEGLVEFISGKFK